MPVGTTLARSGPTAPRSVLGLGAAPTPQGRSRLVRWATGKDSDPVWARAGVRALLCASAMVYFWGLGAGGWAYGYYSAAVQAGLSSWKAALLGAFDGGGLLAIDKPPAALWLMELSCRALGLNSCGILVPEAVAGVTTVGLVYLTVRRWSGPGAGLMAAGAAAATPAAVASFRFNNPDAVLACLLVGAAYCTVRAAEAEGRGWAVGAGTCLGFGFLTKMSEVFLVFPALACAFWATSRRPRAKKAGLLGWATLSFLVSAGWWLVLVALIPPGDRPYLDSTTDNNVFQLIFGYNGLDRLTGSNVAHGATTGAAEAGWHDLLRLFGPEMGTQISWLLPTALLVGLAGYFLARGEGAAARGDRAALVLWGLWLIVMGGLFSAGGGLVNPYYTVALAPCLGGLIGVGGSVLWRHRRERLSELVVAGAVALTSVWSFDLLDRSKPWLPALRGCVLGAGLVAAAVLASGRKMRRRACFAVGALVMSVALAGPLAYCIGAVVNPPPSADPVAELPGTGDSPSVAPALGGQLEISRPDAQLVRLLEMGHHGYTWVAAVVGAERAAGYQLATGQPVIAVGGWSTTTPVPTLVRFRALVLAHRVHFFIFTPGFAGPGPHPGKLGTEAAVITSWVVRNFPARPIGGALVYNLASQRGAERQESTSRAAEPKPNLSSGQYWTATGDAAVLPLPHLGRASGL